MSAGNAATVGLDGLDPVADDLEAFHFGPLVDLDAAPRRLRGITPGNRIVPRGAAVGMPEPAKDLERALHAAIKKVTQSITDLRFNTAISEMMVFVNEATKAAAIPREWFEMFVKILSPFAPHVTEELWQRLGHRSTIAYQPWPAFDEAKIARDVITVAVQVSGKMRSQIEVAADADEATVLAAAKADERIQGYIAGKAIKREIYVKGRLVNLVV